MQRWLSGACILCMVLSVFIGGSSAQSIPAIVNVMIDYDYPPHPTKAQLAESHDSLASLLKEINRRNLSATIYLITEVASYDRLYLTTLGRNQKLEFALNGNSSGEMLSSMSYYDQKELLRSMKARVDSAHYCSINTVDARGFRPQSFDQNDDTFRVLDEMGMAYDSGFKAGILYLPGHELDVWPYEADGHSFYAVPVSTAELSGERVWLQDKAIRDGKNLSADKWGGLLMMKLNESSTKGEPMAVIFSATVSGSGEYLKALSGFLDYAISKNASFVTTMELVDIARSDGNAT